MCQQHRRSGDVEMQQVTPGMWRVTFRPHRHTLQALERPRPDWRAQHNRCSRVAAVQRLPFSAGRLPSICNGRPTPVASKQNLNPLISLTADSSFGMVCEHQRCQRESTGTALPSAAHAGGACCCSIAGAAQGVMQPAAARPGQSFRSERLQRGAAVQVRCLPPASRSTSASPHSLYNQPPVVLCLIPLRLPQQAHLHRRARLPRNRPKVCGHDQYAAA